MKGRWHALCDLLKHDDCTGAGPIQILADQPFYNEDDLPFVVGGGGAVLHVLPDAGFNKESLAGSEDERLMIVDCPDEEGWLVPDDIVANWLNRNITCPELEDIILAHPLYEYLTMPDEEGRSRGGHRGELIQWAPGIPELASVYAPEYLPEDPDAPLVNQDKDAYSEAVADLMRQFEASFHPSEMEVGVRFSQRLEVGEPGELDPNWIGQIAA